MSCYIINIGVNHGLNVPEMKKRREEEPEEGTSPAAGR